MRIMVVNAGSSSMKLSLLDAHDTDDQVDLVEQADLEVRSSGLDGSTLISTTKGWRPDVIGHRIVHGGEVFTGATRIDAGVEKQLRQLTDLAPLHQPAALAALDTVTAAFPDVEAIACFDTAFHATIPLEASTYAVPREWREKYRIRRYGFHGLSHAYCSRRAAELVGRPAGELRTVSCHLGAGASLAAVNGGRSVDTTMGFTPLEGLVMATRSGSVDPGLVLWLEEHEQLSPHTIAVALEERSGLLALAGTADMRQVESAAQRGEPDARLALDVYVHRLVAGIAAMTAALGGLDVLAFTGGVGERSPIIRSAVADRLGYLGVAISGADAGSDRSTNRDRDISTPGASVRSLVITAREDLQIVLEIRELHDQGR